MNFIDISMEKNVECTSVDLQKLILEKFGLSLTTSSIQYTRRKLGWVLSGIKYCQLIRIPNEIARLEFVQKCVECKDDFANVIFTDESTIMLDKHGRLCFKKRGELSKLRPSVKHSYKVHVWAGISKRGPTNIFQWHNFKGHPETICGSSLP
ncbi:uncharacterized protein LOC130644934 [Hydractinia symbiolongicarpus]|uniref:uncharacterized protein LOC130644934 n=1 Tax=Hydractinia symbiolongicarpus TaxID=13093 RepID=UPI00255017FA|nr:uncharacterized protein LOC130644934 [Hydractinia symbiolongicarpus]